MSACPFARLWVCVFSLISFGQTDGSSWNFLRASWYCDMTPESCNLPTCWEWLRWARSRGNTEGTAAGRRIVGTRFHSNEYDWRSNALHTRSRRFLGKEIQRRFRSHGDRKQSNSEERYNSTDEGGDLHTVRPEPASGRELTNRIWQYNRREPEVRRRSQKWGLLFCGVVTVTFRVLSLFLVTKCCSYSKTVL
jgi:hypothetical protein